MKSAETDNLTTNNYVINVCVNEDTVLQPFCEYLVEGNIEGETTRCSFLFSPYNDKLSMRSVLGAVSVVKPLKGLIPVRVINFV